MSSSSSSKVLLGVLAGAAAGALLGVLLAPEKGSVTRDKLAKLGEDYAGDVTDKIKELRDMLSDKIESFKEDGMNLVEKGKSKFDEVKGQTRSTAGNSTSGSNQGSSHTGGGHTGGGYTSHA
jgi:gas vesicle protein